MNDSAKAWTLVALVLVLLSVGMNLWAQWSEPKRPRITSTSFVLQSASGKALDGAYSMSVLASPGGEREMPLDELDEWSGDLVDGRLEYEVPEWASWLSMTVLDDEGRRLLGVTLSVANLRPETVLLVP